MNLKLWGIYGLCLANEFELAELLQLCIMYDIRIECTQHFTSKYKTNLYWLIRNNCIEATNKKMMTRVEIASGKVFKNLAELKEYVKC